MNTRAAQSPPPIGDVEPATERLSFLRSEAALGAVRRCAANGTRMAPMLLEEASYYAEQRWKLTGLAIAGELLAEGLFTWQVKRQREERTREHAP